MAELRLQVGQRPDTWDVLDPVGNWVATFAEKEDAEQFLEAEVWRSERAALQAEHADKLMDTEEEARLQVVDELCALMDRLGLPDVEAPRWGMDWIEARLELLAKRVEVPGA